MRLSQCYAPTPRSQRVTSDLGWSASAAPPATGQFVSSKITAQDDPLRMKHK